MNDRSALSFFAPASARPFGDRVADALRVPLAPLEEREFEDGEHKSRPLASVRGHDVFVLAALHSQSAGSVNDALVRLLFLLATLKDDGAARVTAVTPYLCYARKDRRTKARDPVSMRYLASLFEAVGVDRIVTLDVHNLAAYQNAFRIPAEHLEARELLVEHAAARLTGIAAAVVSPDVGGVKRAEAFRQSLERRLGTAVAPGFMEKHRSAGQISGEILIADVAGRTVILVDDLIVSGTTLVRAARACRAAGAQRVIAFATHGAFTDGARDALADAALDEVVVTDSISPLALTAPEALRKLTVIGISGFIAQAIQRLHDDGSLVELNESAASSVGAIS